MAYVPSTIPQETQGTEFIKWLQDELAKISQAVNQPDQSQYQSLNAEPVKLREGMVVLADGTNWDPGSGQGFYAYYGGSWHKLG